ncbi:hypothetical protein ACQQ2Q_19770 [Agrobacterium sp. ES01]|uniref:hypothetical protein n=1 Tax=Agrobacterium sp. ES01 TaxID=3420714 RepID=UPI003D0AE693
MKTTRRKILSIGLLSAGALSATVNAQTAIAAEGECAENSCDPFPVFGEKPRLSREEFNEMAQPVVELVMQGMEKTEAIKLSSDDINTVRQKVYSSFERLVSKYRTIDPQ